MTAFRAPQMQTGMRLGEAVNPLCPAGFDHSRTRRRRCVRASASSALLFVVVSLGITAGCTGATDAGAPLDDLSGTWINEEPATRSIRQLRLRAREGVVLVEVWGACSPYDCYWGTELADTREWEANRRLRVVWNQGFVVTTQVLSPVDENRIRLNTMTHFVDGSGRSDLDTTEYFRRQ